MVRRKKDLVWHKYIGAFSLVVLLIVISSLVFRLVGMVRASSYDGTHRFTVVIDTPIETALLTLEPGMKRAAYLLLPQNAKIPASTGEGEYYLGALYEVGALDGRGGPLLTRETQSFIGAPVDGWIAIKIESSKMKIESSEGLFSFQNLALVLHNLQNGSIDTNLTPLDIIRITSSLSGLKQEETKIVDFLEFVAFQENTVAEIKAVDIRESSIDSLARQFFSDSTIVDERLPVTIVNGTDRKGMGNRVARILSNGGVNVISVTTAKEPLDRTIVEVTQKQSGAYTLERLKKWFGVDSPIVTDLVKEDIKLYIGKDIWDF